MASRVVLTAEDGSLKGRSFVFSDHVSCIMGRAPDCNPRLPDDTDHRFISRYHCMLEVNPPSIAIRDFGSLNGTYVNGTKIGQREHNQTAEEGQKMFSPEHTLKHNDAIRLGGTLFRIGIHTFIECEACGMEIIAQKLKAAERTPGYYVCDACWAPSKVQAPPSPASPSPAPALKIEAPTLSDEMGPLIPEDNYSLCPSYTVDPMADLMDAIFADETPRSTPQMDQARTTDRPAAVTPPRSGGNSDTRTSNGLSPEKRCAKCGKSVAQEAEAMGQGRYTCAECRKNPLDLIDEIINNAQTPESKTDDAPTKIEGYRIIRQLGAGGAGLVYLAEESQSGRQVALKVLLPQVAVSPKARKSFMLEAKNTQALKHRNIVALDKYGDINGTFYLALEYCDGGSVDALIRRKGGRLPVETSLVIALQTLDGLEYAHSAEVEVLLDGGSTVTSRGLVHRDLKPANLLLGGPPESRIVKVADYGLGKAFEAAGLSGHTRTGQRAGSPWFMPRQQVVNFKYSKPDVDVYGMAATLYFMITGFYPRDFPKGKDPWQIVLQTKPVPVADRGAPIPAKLAAFLDKSLDDSGTLSFPSIEAFRTELKAAIAK